MVAVEIVKPTEFDGQTWKPVYYKTATASVGTSDTTVASGKLMIVKMKLVNTDGTNATTVTIKDDTTTIDTIDLSAGETKEVDFPYVIDKSLVMVSSATTVNVVVTYKAWRDLE